MARLVESSGRSNAMNSYGRNPNQVPLARNERKVQVVKAYGTFNNTGVCPDGSVCTPSVPPAEVDFTLNIYRQGGGYTGEVYIVSYDTRTKVNSNDLIYYQDHGGEYVLCIFCVHTQNSGYNYELIMNLVPCNSSNSGTIYGYIAPIYSAGFNVGGVLTSGEISFCEMNMRPCNLNPTFIVPPRVEGEAGCSCECQTADE